MSEEIWKPVVGFEGLYEVSNMGRLKSIPRARTKGGILHCQKTCWGYLICNLWKEGEVHSFSVHRLVAEAFIPNPEGKQTVNHIDCNRENNCVSNLEWTSQKENIQHSVNLGHYENVGAEKKAVAQYDLQGNFIVAYKSISEAAKETGLFVQNISKCCHGHLKKTGGYAWRFAEGGESIGN